MPSTDLSLKSGKGFQLKHVAPVWVPAVSGWLVGCCTTDTLLPCLLIHPSLPRSRSTLPLPFTLPRSPVSWTPTSFPTCPKLHLHPTHKQVNPVRSRYSAIAGRRFAMPCAGGRGNWGVSRQECRHFRLQLAGLPPAPGAAAGAGEPIAHTCAASAGARTASPRYLQLLSWVVGTPSATQAGLVVTST